jgi:uncharacterized membrane protein HdeD (DUF308 family)
MDRETALRGQSGSNWVPIAEGTVLLLLGIVTIAWPQITFYAFTVAFGLYALIAGLIKGFSGIIHIGQGWKSIAAILIGILLVGVGSYILNHPGITAVTLVILIGLSFVIRGIGDIVIASEDNTDHRVLNILAGILGIIAGFILLRYPVGGGLAYVWVLGIYALVAGPMIIAQGFTHKA